MILMRGPVGEFEVPFDEAIFGPARNESRYWIKRERAEPVLVPDISRFGEKDKAKKVQNWEDVPAGSSMEGSAASAPAGKGLPAVEAGDAASHARAGRTAWE